ncbi:uncharacterized protein I206_102899 [Kwoniella pini CBS 10737]|uniref:SWR1-complex protein 5 n=1 Tax=Kwoniella pini CBS 10737 TaxID=1296096 RepID=A0A1B9I6N7_9TREE|nr:uncharacterized protein I206_03249 [Kwoniella pini CBS 10737]OCF51183.1 hypothetical protein I206_03249 [Kwoniella pini CBS 10737]
MSTLATADLGSDSENDGDFIPKSPIKRKSKSKNTDKRKIKKIKLSNEGEDESDSDSMTSSSESEIENEESRESVDEKVQLDLVEERKRKAREEFEKMKFELNNSGGSNSNSGKTKEIIEMIEIKRARRFAGETIYEIVKIRKDDPEAINYLTKQQKEIDIKENDGSQNGEINEMDLINKIDPAISITSNNQSSSIIDNNESIKSPKPSLENINPRSKVGQPIRKKPRQSLEAMSAALDKGKKMTTLEKSQLDWKSHTKSIKGLNDELNLNRKNGTGYLDKKDFLNRVDERRSSAFEMKK